MAEGKKQGNSLYTEMLDIHKHIFEQLKYAEAKCGIATTIILGFFGVLARILYIFVEDRNLHMFTSPKWFDWVAFLSLFACIILCIWCLLILLKVFKPKTDNTEKNLKEFQGNIYFFENIAGIKSDDFLECVKRKFGVSELKNRGALLDLSNQICVLSQITSAKHRNCKKVFNKIKWVFPIFVLFLVAGGLSTQAQGAVVM